MGTVTVTLRSRLRKSGKSALYLDINVDGERRMEYLKLYLTNGTGRKDKLEDKETMRVAETIKAKRLMELREGQPDLKPKRRRVLLHDYVESIVASKKGATKTTWRCMAIHLLNYDPDKRIYLDEVTPEWVNGFRGYLDRVEKFKVSKGGQRVDDGVLLSQGSKNILLHKLKAVFNQAEEDWLIDRNPTKNVDMFKKSDKEREYLTLEELKLLLQTPSAGKSVCRAFIFSCMTGLRWSDISSLRWGDVREYDGHLRLVFTQQKTKLLEYLDLSEQAAEWMGERKEDGRKIFENLPGIQYGRHYIERWVKEAGINKHITFHCGRHTFATMLISQGVDLYTVSKLLGHRSIQTTQIYARMLDKTKKAAVEKLPRLF